MIIENLVNHQQLTIIIIKFSCYHHGKQCSSGQWAQAYLRQRIQLIDS